MKSEGLDQIIRKLGGLPSPGHEAWKYTPLRFLGEEGYSINTSVGDNEPKENLALAGADLLNFSEGGLRGDFSRLGKGIKVEVREVPPDSAESSDFSKKLGRALSQKEAFIGISDHTRLSRPLQLLHYFSAEENVIEAQPCRISVGAGAHLVLIQLFSGHGPYLRNALEFISLQEGATLDYYRIEVEGDSARHLGYTEIEVGPSATVNFWNFAVGSKLVRSELKVRFLGEGAAGNFWGLSLGDLNQVVDHQTDIAHLSPRTTSRQNYKGILAGKSRSTFSGRVFIDSDCDGVDSSQTNKSLLLSQGAEANTKPQLEVYSDDVKATHGAAVGQIDPEELFYLQSRGLSPVEAGAILSLGFLDEIFMTVREEGVRGFVRGIFLDRFKRMSWERT